MAVTLNANNSAHTHATDITQLDNGNLTIAAGTKTALIAKIHISNSTTPTITSVQWDIAGTPQAMTLITSIANGNEGRTYIYGLLNPTTGNRTCRMALSGLTSEVFFNLTAYDGVEDSSFGAAFIAATPATGTSTTPSITISSATGDMTVAAVTGPQVLSSPTQTQTHLDNGGAATSAGGSRAVGAASVTHQWTLASLVPWSMAGANMVAAVLATDLNVLIGEPITGSSVLN